MCSKKTRSVLLADKAISSLILWRPPAPYLTHASVKEEGKRQEILINMELLYILNYNI